MTEGNETYTKCYIGNSCYFRQDPINSSDLPLPPHRATPVHPAEGYSRMKPQEGIGRANSVSGRPAEREVSKQLCQLCQHMALKQGGSAAKLVYFYLRQYGPCTMPSASRPSCGGPRSCMRRRSTTISSRISGIRVSVV